MRFLSLAPLRSATLIGVATLAASAALAQPTPDWSTRPALTEAPAFTPPAVERHALSNGLPVLFVDKPGVPLAQINLLVRAGSVDDGPKDGLAAFTADLMDEGAGDLDALELADAVDFLGIDLTTSAGLHSLQVRLHTPLSKLDDALALMADVALRPTFAEADVDRVRFSSLTGYLVLSGQRRQRVRVSVMLHGADEVAALVGRRVRAPGAETSTRQFREYIALYGGRPRPKR